MKDVQASCGLNLETEAPELLEDAGLILDNSGVTHQDPLTPPEFGNPNTVTGPGGVIAVVKLETEDDSCVIEKDNRAKAATIDKLKTERDELRKQVSRMEAQQATNTSKVTFLTISAYIKLILNMFSDSC